MKKQLFSLAAIFAASFATAAGGMVFTNTINSVLPDHPSLNGTYWGWELRTNLTNAQMPLPSISTLDLPTSKLAYLNLETHNSNGNWNNPANAGTAGYRVYSRRDPSIDFRVGSSIRAKLVFSAGWHIISDSPVPGAMIGIQDIRGYFFGIGFAHNLSGTQRYFRVITSPFSGAGTEWIPIPKTTEYFHEPSGYGSYYDIELVIAGSRASVLIGGREMKNEGGTLVKVDAGAPLSNLIFTQWINHGGVIVGDYSTTSAGSLGIASLSYY
ncbi:MAG: hypothetical protein ACKVQS_08375 [Fimbriimonadaceae bacterium]